jgi:hypothetical protein
MRRRQDNLMSGVSGRSGKPEDLIAALWLAQLSGPHESRTASLDARRVANKHVARARHGLPAHHTAGRASSAD